MAEITVWRNLETGQLEGYSERDQRAYNKMKHKLESLAPGEMFNIECWFPRNGQFHRLHMKMETALFANQDRFLVFERFRDWLKVGAGHCDIAPDSSGQLIAVPRSISYRKMDDEAMSHFHEQVKAFLYCEHAYQFLWPHLDPAKAFEMMDAVISLY